MSYSKKLVALSVKSCKSVYEICKHKAAFRRQFKCCNDFIAWVSSKASNAALRGKKHIMPRIPGYIVIVIARADPDTDHTFYAWVTIEHENLLEMFEEAREGMFINTYEDQKVYGFIYH